MLLPIKGDKPIKGRKPGPRDIEGFGEIITPGTGDAPAGIYPDTEERD